ncbi:MAG: hypothetical protein WD397_05355 [Wenzhouxiangellaceae bacterium]
MDGKRLTACLLGMVLACASAAASGQVRESISHEGVGVDFSTTSPAGAALERARAGSDFRLHFDLRDTRGRPIAGAYPAAWIHPRFDDEQPTAELCRQKARTFLGGSLFSRAELDLNTYYVLALNDAASVSVVDPLFGFGGSRLRSMVPLPSPGYDWVKGRGDEHVFISLPDSNQLARLNTADWQVKTLSGADAGRAWHAPGRLALQPDGHYLWLAVAEGVAVFETEPWRWVTTIALADDAAEIETAGDNARRAEISFSPDSRHVFISRYGNGAVSVIDSHTLTRTHTIETGEQPVSLAWSEPGDALYIAHAGEGGIAVLPRRALSETRPRLTRIEAEPGITTLRFSPDGRWGFVLNQRTRQVSLLDPASQRLIQHGGIGPQPEQISFSNDIAYIRHGGSEILYMVALDDPDLGREGAPIAVVDTPGGDSAFHGHAPYTPANGIVKAPGASAVLIANPGDQAVYFYKEGMAAPMGNFNNYGHAPRAVLAVDRSLREQRRPGRYETVARLDTHGVHDVVFLLDNPRILHCFTLDIAPDPAAPVVAERDWTVQAIDPPSRLKVGRAHRVNLQLRPETTTGAAHLADTPINVLVAMSSGQWRQRVEVRSDAAGRFALHIKPPLPGHYQIHIEAPLPGLDEPDRPALVLAAE